MVTTDKSIVPFSVVQTDNGSQDDLRLLFKRNLNNKVRNILITEKRYTKLP